MNFERGKDPKISMNVGASETTIPNLIVSLFKINEKIQTIYSLSYGVLVIRVNKEFFAYWKLRRFLKKADFWKYILGYTENKNKISQKAKVDFKDYYFLLSHKTAYLFKEKTYRRREII